MSIDSAGFQAIVLAAGRGSRMGSDLPKVLLPICGRSVLEHVLDVLRRVDIRRPVVVINRQGDIIREALGDCAEYVVQKEQVGSGHAVTCAREAAGGAGNILVMCGDSPLFRAETIRSMMSEHALNSATVTLVSAVMDDPSGYGRILRSPDGNVSGVVEEKLADEEQKRVQEINGGSYAFEAGWLWENLHLIPKNEVGEYCLTDMVSIALAQGRRVIAVPSDPEEVSGINTPRQLEAAKRALRARGDC